MNPRRATSLSRRKAVAAGLAALVVGTPRPERAAARAILQRGMSGGGLARLEGDDPRLANFSLFASAMQLPEGTTIFLGLIQWIEAGVDLRLQSTEVSQCIPIEGRSDGAEIRGRLKVNDEGDYPFVIQAFDTGGPGSGLDSIRIEVNGPDARQGAAAPASDDEFTYEATASVVAGDFQWIVVDVEIPT